MAYLSPICLKFATIILNLCFLAGGSVLLAFGILLSQIEYFNIQIFGNLQLGILSLVIGAIVILTATFGFISIIFQPSICLKIYAAILFCLFAFQLPLGIMSIDKIENPESFLNEIHKLMKELSTENEPDFQELQKQLGCFGVEQCTFEFRNKSEYYITVIGYSAIIVSSLQLTTALFAMGIRKTVKEGFKCH